MATRKGKHKHSTLGSEPAKDFCKKPPTQIQLDNIGEWF